MELSSDFEDNLRDALVEDIERKTLDDPGNLAFQFRQMIVENFEAYAERNGYDLGDVIDDIRVLEADRSGDGVSVTIGTDDGLIALFEFGVSPHTIRGDPLHFYWEEADTWVKTDEVNWGSETGGIPEARAFRDAIHQLRGSIQRRDAQGRFA